MKTQQQKLEDIDDAIARWMARGFRAQNAINKLTKKRKRLVKKTTPVFAGAPVAESVDKYDRIVARAQEIVEGKPKRRKA